MTEILTQAKLKEILDYDQETGIFVWKVRRSSRAGPGDIAGGKSSHGYLMTRVEGKPYMLHRLAWLWVFGTMPNGDVDHIDHDVTNNRIANLRDVTRSENLQNQVRAKSQNGTKFLGVTYRKDRGKYAAQIFVKGKHISLGHFSIAQDAHAAYVAAKRVMHSTCTL